jgi:beta-lactamase regulating signal transducer with metallopeptidase domain
MTVTTSYARIKTIATQFESAPLQTIPEIGSIVNVSTVTSVVIGISLVLLTVVCLAVLLIFIIAQKYRKRKQQIDLAGHEYDEPSFYDHLNHDSHQNEDIFTSPNDCYVKRSQPVVGGTLQMHHNPSYQMTILNHLTSTH